MRKCSSIRACRVVGARSKWFTVASHARWKRFSVGAYTRREGLRILVHGEVAARRKFLAVWGRAGLDRFAFFVNWVESTRWERSVVRAHSRRKRLSVGSFSRSDWFQIIINRVRFLLVQRCAIGSSSFRDHVSVGSGRVELVVRKRLAFRSFSLGKWISSLVESRRKWITTRVSREMCGRTEWFFVGSFSSRSRFAIRAHRVEVSGREFCAVGSFSRRKRFALFVDSRREWLAIRSDRGLVSRFERSAVRSDTRWQSFAVRSDWIEGSWREIFAIGSFARRQRISLRIHSGW
jgi:hypothetical protein